MSKVLVIYYSFEGNTRFVAEAIAKETGADILELKVKQDLTTKGFMKFFWGGRQVVFKKTPELAPFDKNPTDYDVIFIGTPVWAFSFAPALRSFFDQSKLANKKVAVFCTDEGLAGKTLVNMKNELKDNEIIGESEFIMPLNRQADCEAQAQQWVHSLLETTD